MQYKSLIFNGEKITQQNKIIQKLQQEKFFWLIDSEVENAQIEIKNNTLIWEDGIFFNGHWYYGIFKNGIFYGHWENGIWEGGDFKGTGQPNKK